MIKGMHIDYNKLKILEIKSFHSHFDFPGDADKNLKHEIDSIMKTMDF